MAYSDPAKKREWQLKNKDKLNAYNRARYAADPTKQKIASRRWALAHQEHRNEKARLWMVKNRSRLYSRETPEGRARLVAESERRRRYRMELKVEILTHYGRGKLRCVTKGCAVTDIDMLTLDHIEDNGAEHRRTLGNKSRVYRSLKQQNYPEGFQTLCANHQLKKRDSASRATKARKG